MQRDPEYRQLTRKHEIHQGVGDIHVFTEAQVSEMKHIVEMAVAIIERKARTVWRGIGLQFARTHTMFKHFVSKFDGGRNT